MVWSHTYCSSTCARVHHMVVRTWLQRMCTRRTCAFKHVHIVQWPFVVMPWSFCICQITTRSYTKFKNERRTVIGYGIRNRYGICGVTEVMYCVSHQDFFYTYMYVYFLISYRYALPLPLFLRLQHCLHVCWQNCFNHNSLSIVTEQ